MLIDVEEGIKWSNLACNEPMEGWNKLKIWWFYEGESKALQ
jgi:hypothetical protein